MRQSYFKVIFTVALICSVFFVSTPVVALADEVESGAEEEVVDIDVSIPVSVASVEQELTSNVVATASEVPEYFYQGATSIHTQMSSGLLVFSNAVGNALNGYSTYASYEIDIPVLFRLSVERGHTYSGQVYFYFYGNLPDVSGDRSGNTYTCAWKTFSVGGVQQESVYDGVTVSYYGFLSSSSNSSTAESQCTMCITFDNYQPTFTGDLNVNAMITMNALLWCKSIMAEKVAYIPGVVAECTVSSDWYGDLYDYPTDAIIDSDGTLIKNQTEQQQQIAEQQESAAQERQEEIVGGFSDDGYDNNVSGANDEVNNYLDAESNLVSDQMGNVNSYIDDNFDTGLLTNYAPAIASVSTWYSQIWGSFGNLSTVFVVVLALGLASMIIGIKGRGSS